MQESLDLDFTGCPFFLRDKKLVAEAESALRDGVKEGRIKTFEKDGQIFLSVDCLVSILKLKSHNLVSSTFEELLKAVFKKSYFRNVKNYRYQLGIYEKGGGLYKIFKHILSHRFEDCEKAGTNFVLPNIALGVVLASFRASEFLFTLSSETLLDRLKGVEVMATKNTNTNESENKALKISDRLKQATELLHSIEELGISATEAVKILKTVAAI